MRQFISIVLLLCMHCVARGQTTFDYEYWFDNDRSMLHTGTSSNGAWQMEVDLDDLTYSFHTIHLQVRNSKGDLSSPVSRHFVKVRPTASQLVGHYWFDNDPSTMQTSNVLNGTFDVDVYGMREGYHTFHYQAIDNQGNASSVVTALIYKMAHKGDVKTFRCWFDNDYSTLQDNLPAKEVAMLDVSQLTDGFHVVHVQADGVTPTAAHSYYFIKQPQTMGVEYITLVCTIDDELYKQERVTNTGGTMLWNFDISNLKQGLHRIQVLGVTPSGAATSSYSTFFLRAATEAEVADMKLCYYIDNDDFTVNEGVYANGGFHFNLDVSQLTDGLHRLAYFMSNGNGITTKVTSQFFWKTPVGGNGIMEYKYWLNDKSSEEDVQVVKLAERTNPYQLISLLPVAPQSIRSSCFEFRVKNNQPVIYAKNDVHIRFTEATGRFTDVSKQFVDESVKQEVTDITPIYNGERKTMAVPEKDAIHWLKFYAEEGDTVTFKTDQAASIQVFSPEGKEIYSASGSTSVKQGGCHTWIDGTYFVALHDVTGSRPNISLDFTHLAKYDVVSYDVATVGNGGCSTITFKGNGFKDLYAVDFVNAANDSIHAFSIGHESDGTTSVTADFTDAAVGEYTVLFHFTEGKKYVYDAITVEEAMPIELATEVTFPRSFGHVVTYTCKITNNGNMTAYAVPIYTWLKSKRLDGIYHIDYDGLDLAGAFDGVVTDSLTESEIAELQARSKALGDDHHFLKFWAEDEDHPGDSVFVRSNYFFTNIAPYETKTLRLTISTREVDTYAYFTVPEDWPSYQVAQVEGVAGARARFRAPSMKDKYCCIRNKVECVATLVADGASIANMILQYAPDVSTQVIAAATDCVAGAASKIISTAGTVMCDDNSVEKNFWDKVNAALDGTSTISTLSSCLSQLLPWKKVKAILDGIGNVTGGASMSFGLGVDMTNCAIAFTSKVPGCPPIPPGGGGAQGGKSHDPNEIYGYLAESGSKFMTDEVEKVNYRIEFENDTAFATRSAMTVVIRDTLDSKLFDLATYAPTGIKIGEKVEYLDGEPNFVKTIDMRPEINGLVEVEGKYNATKGILTWTFTSIDPITMEPTNDPMDGFLPVNVDGNGIGEVTFDIALKQKLAEGTVIPNRASIIFDINEPILTPTWKNTIDATAPESHVADVQMATDSTAAVRIAATDELSGPWRYNVYVQYGSGAWFLGAENVPIDSVARVKVYEGINHGFYTLVTDSAGNVEQKAAAREFTFEVFGSQVDTNTQIELAQGWNWISHNQQEPLSVEALKPASARMLGQTEETINDSRFGWMGDLEELLPTQMYKIQTDEVKTVQLSGRLFNAGFRAVPLYEGWNWLGYPVANTMTPAEALQKLEAEEGDFLIGQDGMATYSKGQWTGTLTEMVPGLGYMYRSGSDKNLFYNATAQASSRRVQSSQSTVHSSEMPEGWTVNKRKYPNVMGVIAQLWHEDNMANSDEWLLGAFCGDECRGIAKVVDGTLMMNVYGQSGEMIVFRAMNYETGEVLYAAEQETFRADVVGTMNSPYQMHIGDATGIAGNNAGSISDSRYYDLQGRTVNDINAQKGLYIVTDSQRNKTQKVVKK